MALRLRSYVELIERHRAGVLSADDFREAYVTQFKKEQEPFREEAYQVLEALFEDADSYCSDPALLSGTTGTIGAEEFKKRIEKAYRKLIELST